MRGKFARTAAFLVAANIVAAAVVGFITWRNAHEAANIHLTAVSFSDLPGWAGGDHRPALAAFRRSCAVLLKFPGDHPMGGIGYAGHAADWRGVCSALPADSANARQARDYFEQHFSPFEVEATEKPAFFTGYYEPLLAGSRKKTGRFQWPIYGKPADLIEVHPALFNRTGARFYGRVTRGELLPYPTRAEIDALGLSTAPVLLYTDDPIGAFFLSIQGSGRVRFPDGSFGRLEFAGTNGRRYTAIGRVLIAEKLLARENVSLQTIRAWLEQHPAEGRRIMEANESYVFYDLAPLGDSSLGSDGNEGVPVTPKASLAVDTAVHALGVPVFAVVPMPQSPFADLGPHFEKLLVAQDVGGAIKGPARADIFFGFGPEAEWAAGHLKSHGRFFVLLPKALAATMGTAKAFPDSTG